MRAPAAERAPARGHLPGLDGLRGLAVAAVVIYHLWPQVLPAGFLGVSVFFTLSGFLITRLLLLDRSRAGGVDLRRFWTRRFRRLMPVAVVVLAAIAAVWLITGWMTRAIDGDITAALLYVANWRFLFTGSAYGAATGTSPVLHFWSLAIEEQFYLLYPLAMWGVLRWKRARTTAVAILLGGLLAASLAFIWFHSGEQLEVYYSTFSRAAELLVGGLLAVVTTALPLDRFRTWTRSIGVAAGLALVALMARTDIYTPVYSRGGLAGVALLSAAVILAATDTGRFEWALSRRPLLWLGLVSYAVYLIHWPLLIALHESGITPWLVSLGTVAGTLVLAALSGRLLERPIREGRWTRPRPVLLVAPAMSLVLVLCLVGSRTAPVIGIDYAAAQATLDQLAPQTATEVALLPEPAAPASPAVPRPLSVALFGDSTALMLAAGGAEADPGLQVVGGSAQLACTISRRGELKGYAYSDNGAPGSVDHCDWTTAWPDAIPPGGIDRALIYAGFWDTLPRRIPDVFAGWRTIEDETYRDYLRSEMVAVTETLHAAGAAEVVWLTLAPDTKTNSPTNAKRVDLYNALIDDTVAAHPDYAAKVDLGSYLTEPGRSLRPDGVHVSAATGATLWRDWLLEEVAATGPGPTGPRS